MLFEAAKLVAARCAAALETTSSTSYPQSPLSSVLEAGPSAVGAEEEGAPPRPGTSAVFLPTVEPTGPSEQPSAAPPPPSGLPVPSLYNSAFIWGHVCGPSVLTRVTESMAICGDRRRTPLLTKTPPPAQPHISLGRQLGTLWSFAFVLLSTLVGSSPFLHSSELPDPFLLLVLNDVLVLNDPDGTVAGL